MLSESTITMDEAADLTGCIDVDSHEMIPMHMWGEVFGEAASEFVALLQRAEAMKSERAENSLVRPDIVSDSVEANLENVWSIRGPGAPSAVDLGRRTEVLDVMGVERQLVYPTFGLVGVFLRYHPNAHTHMGYDPEGVDRQALGSAAIRAHNDWCVNTMMETWGDRVRPVAILEADSLEQMMTDTENLLSRGVRAFMLPNGMPPAGLSPADRALDPFYRLLASAAVPLTFHIGAEFSLLASQSWGANVPEFVPSIGSSLEFPIQPFWASTMHFASDNFLTAMVLGGVFERHPDLRCGSIEVGASWIGPLADRLDVWAKEFHRRFDGALTMKPSQYINRNVRVAPFHFEDVASYFERYPNVSDVYCFATDFPHREGGRWAKQTFAENLRAAPPEIRQKFFIDNGQWLLPA